MALISVKKSFTAGVDVFIDSFSLTKWTPSLSKKSTSSIWHFVLLARRESDSITTVSPSIVRSSNGVYIGNGEVIEAVVTNKFIVFLVLQVKHFWTASKK